ncbi:MAG: alpha-L-fucosidase [Pirellulales bacterium]|nr:alpha-L-fucosidase [Pirellulales bacterium]
MHQQKLPRRNFLAGATSTALAAGVLAPVQARDAHVAGDESTQTGSQRLSLARLQNWESLGYGMFVHFGMSTFTGSELPDGRAPAALYAPDRLDVDQWVSVARDAGMKYIVLTTKHVAGHCLWPSKCSDYTVANSTDKTNVLEKFCAACEKRDVLPGFYYCSWDNHHRFGGKTPSDGGPWGRMNSFPETQKSRDELPPFTTSLYQNFQTAQVTELLTQFGPIAESWIDIPGVLGRGYRKFLYNHIAALQPQTVIMMNNGVSDGAKFKVDYAWPTDLITLERNVPPKNGHRKWREIEGKEYYLPGETCDPIGKEWFWVPGDKPRSDEALAKQFEVCRAGGVNLLLDVPPDKHGLIPDESVAALMRLRKNAKI